jgi:predicted small metal-binding protein
MARKIIDCRDFPGPCSLAVSGDEQEVVRAQAAHLAVVHDMPDTAEVRAYVRSMLKDDPEGTSIVAANVGARK